MSNPNLRFGKVHRAGSAKVVTLPSQWCREMGIARGDTMVVTFPSVGVVQYRKVLAGEQPRTIRW